MKLTQKSIATIKPPTDRPETHWDTEVRGFGLKVTSPSAKYPEGSKVFVFEYRPNGGGRGNYVKRLTLGSLAELKPEAARKRAEQAQADVRTGRDPMAEKVERRDEATLAEGWADYEKAMERRWKASTKALIAGRWANHIAPVLGKSKVSAIGARDVQRLHARISEDSPVAANRVLANLSAFYGWWLRMHPGALPANPVAAVDRNPEEPRRNYLSPEELRRLFAALETAVTEGVPWDEKNGARGKRKAWAKHTPGAAHRRSFVTAPAARALRLLAYSGCRLREVLHLQWQSVDFAGRRLVLTDTKTGYRMIPLSEASLSILRDALTELPAEPNPEHHVFAEIPGGAARHDLHRPWRTVLRAAGLPASTRIHDLRHSAASLLINSGAGLELVAGVLGHKSAQTARRYSHLADSTVRAAAELIAVQIAGPALPAPAEVMEEDLIG
ncbi:MAG: site-specific integrase [Sphingomonadales bacterium]|nr:site-specific integrase [Sphingomonadales bacterium]